MSLRVRSGGGPSARRAPGRGRTRRRWTVAALATVTGVLAWLDLESPNGVYGWVFVAVGVVAALAGVRWARIRRPAPAAEPGASGATPTVGAWVLFREALVLGLTGFGGGLAVLSQIEQRLVERRRWVSIRRFLETAAIAQGLPGAVATNAIALIGLEVRGVAGALVGTVGFVLPSFLMLLIAALLYAQVRHLAAVDGLFRGLTPAVSAMVLLTAVRLGGRAVLLPDGRPGGWRALWEDRWSFAVMMAAAVAVAVARVGVVEVVVLAGVLGVARWTLRKMPDPVAAFELRWRWFRHRVVEAARMGARALPLPWWRRWRDPGSDDLLSWSPLWIAMAPASALVMARLGALGGLATVFLRAGAVTFGGGFAMIPLLESELVQIHGWLTPHEFADAMALGQVTPGPVVITATFVGYRVAGILGALVATASVFAPAWLMALAIGGSVKRVRQSPGVQAFLHGIQPAVVGIMFAAAVSLARSGIDDAAGGLLAVASLAVLWRWKLAPVYVLAGAASLGMLWRFLVP
jgi:chromate transporter